MLVRFSRKEFDKGTIVQIEVDKGKTYFLLHNPTSQDLVALIRYREYNFYPRGLFQKTLVIPPYTIERITGGQGHASRSKAPGKSMTDELKSVGNFTYSNAEDFIKNELWSILSKSEQALEA
ncbi:hypothetical protein VKS41_006364 [Umbelopsis sp. WA50703]